MKTFIVFLAFALVFSGFIVYTDDSNNYVRLQKYLKALAEECAAGGALMIDYYESERLYEEARLNGASEGQLYVISESDAGKYAAFVADNYDAALYPLEHGEVSVTSLNRFRNAAGNECIRVEVEWAAASGYRLIRLPFIDSPAVVTKAAVYEVKM